jgi:DNA-binding transcriptional ArsR family regulator
MTCRCPVFDAYTGDLIQGATPVDGEPHLPACPEAKRAAELARRAEVARVELDATNARRAPGGWAVLPARIVCDPSLSPEARCVLLVLSAHADDHAHPFPSVATIARHLGRSERTVLRVLSELRAAELVEVRHRFRGGEQTTSEYVLRFDRWGRPTPSPVTDRGDTGDTPRGDKRDTPRGDTGGVQNKTTRPAPKEEDQNPPLTPPSSEGGEPADTPFALQGDPLAPLPGETRGERVKRCRLLFGWTPREANRKLDAWDASSLPEAREARERQEKAKREYEARLAEEMAEAEAVYARDFGLAR